MRRPNDALEAALSRTSPELLSGEAVFDAIVVGSGAAGGRASRELCAAGLRVLTLEAGWAETDTHSPLRGPLSRGVSALSNHRAFHALPPALRLVGRRALRSLGRVRQPIQSKCYAWELSPASFVDDVECPYVSAPESPFHWFRSHQLGGRMVVPGHGGQYYRMGPNDFESGRWPIGYATLAPWYERVEAALRMSGGQDDHPAVPAGLLTTIKQPTDWEVAALRALRDTFPAVQPILSRHAAPLDVMSQAAETGNLTCRTGAVVRRVLRGRNGAATGVEWLDRRLKRTVRAQAPVVFLCASAFESTRILMLSRDEHPTSATGMHSDVLGRYAMDHAAVSLGGFQSASPEDVAVAGQAGRCIYMPWPMEAAAGASGAAQLAFGVQIHSHPAGTHRLSVEAVSFAPMLPRFDNRLTLDPSRRDAFGLPILHITCRYGDHERKVGETQAAALRAIADCLELRDASVGSQLAPPGTGIHECGTARMGDDPTTSVVDQNNECWDTKGLYVTDSGSFPALSIQNPTLTLMALTARAAAHAISGRSSS